MSSLELDSECPVCMESFSEFNCVPRVLPCLHDVCGECLKSLLKQECPVCRAEFSKDLGVNRTLLKAIAVVSHLTNEMTHLAKVFPFIQDALEELRASNAHDNKLQKNHDDDKEEEEEKSNLKQSKKNRRATHPPKLDRFAHIIVGNLVDAQDKRGTWYDSEVRAIRKGSFLVVI
eukprot:TRINITY_DN6016_c0_g1_i12.p1 TRINITY_DN6016_c0_g1~~TRINITY_DN6016_c0_g1_i12.p1  ORF type:complete len:175 (+),score=30.28 TRINITY_DN6016_c0_g1_i12:24-548(+)